MPDDTTGGEGGAEPTDESGKSRPPPAEVDTSNIEPTGRFRIYLGAAAGVGKTCAMLDEGWRRHNRGTDVVIGYVETHNRPFTQEMIRDLEVVPRRVVEYRGSRFEEMDTDAVIARHPQVALIDEIAHTNVPGSGPHEKRWQDVLQILEAGIAVISTVNIQHLESIADAVEHMTGTQVRERVPDWVVRQADQTELIDSSPEQLRRRMAHGNIYPPEKIQSALHNFFRTDNLSALRELALRFVADETDDALVDRLRERHVPDVWETTERILVGVDGTPGTDAVVRRAARLAARVRGYLDVVHVVSSETIVPRDGDALAALRKLTDDVGGQWYEIKADEPAKALVKFAVEHQITQIVLGASRRSRWEEIMSGSIVAKVIRLASALDVDVHVIAQRNPAHGNEAKGHGGESRERGGEPKGQ
ncbi:MAG TPA: universal stress protein [Acidimicrobiales bacterium]|nr:universal stress protein [Acidimicrobiales bacterium]